MPRDVTLTRGPRFLGACLAAAGTFFCAAPALAQGVDEFGAYGPEGTYANQSPQYAAFEIRVGPYFPKVDNEFGGAAAPYGQTFGDETHWAVGFEADWQALRLWDFASIGIGGGAAYTQINGSVFDEGGTVTDGSSNLQIVPMHAVLVGRFDYLVRRTQIPFAFYGKAGMGWAYWNSKDSVADSVSADGTVGSGLSFGPQFALGAMLLLDPFERKGAMRLDDSYGINHSYVFFEVMTSALGELTGDQLQVGTDSWLFGVAVEL